MDLIAINDAINTLENEDTTVDNVAELASLYICRDNLSRGVNAPLKREITGTEKELRDIFPYYCKYRDIKRRYQLKEGTEGEVIQGIKNVCREVQEFIETLYCNTDMNKERLCIKQMLEQLNKKYC